MRSAVFRATLREADAALAGHFDRPLTELLFDGGADALQSTELTQPAIVALQCAFAATLRDWGVRRVLRAG